MHWMDQAYDAAEQIVNILEAKGYYDVGASYIFNYDAQELINCSVTCLLSYAVKAMPPNTPYQELQPDCG